MTPEFIQNNILSEKYFILILCGKNIFKLLKTKSSERTELLCEEGIHHLICKVLFHFHRNSVRCIIFSSFHMKETKQGV